MAYRANVNDQLFFDTSASDIAFQLSAARVTLEAGSSGSFLFTIPPGNRQYANLHRLTDYIDVYRDGDNDPVFSGRIYKIRKRMDTQLDVECEGMLSVLADSIFRPVTYDGTLHGLVQAILTNHNSQVEAEKQITVGRLGIADANVYREYKNYETSIARMRDLFQSFGGYPYVRKTASGLRFYWLDHMEDGCDQKVELCSNLLDIKIEDSSDSICTVLIPIGAEDEDGNKITIKSVNSGLDYLVAGNEYLQTYGYVTKVQEWPDVTTPAALKTKGQAFLQASLVSKTTITVTAVDLANAGLSVDSFRIGQNITVTSKPHGIINVGFDCQRQTLDLLNPGSDTLTLGTIQLGYIRNSQGDSYKKLINSIAEQFVTGNAMQSAIRHATDMITGNEGGYLVWHDADGDNLPDEALIMDTKDITTARKIWRANLNGFGYSSTGYNGPYGTAITMDGGIVGSYLTALSVTAEKIAASAITTDKLAANAVTAAKIAAGSISTDKLAANAVTAAKINVTDLFSQAITATNLTITGGSVNIRTGSSNKHVISLTYGNYSGWYAPEQIWFGITNIQTSYMAGHVFHKSNNGASQHTSEWWCQTDNANPYVAKGEFAIDVNYVNCRTVNQYSDERLKTNIETIPIEEAARFINRLRPVVYEMYELMGRKYRGFVAQEVETILDEMTQTMVAETREGYKTIDYISIVPYIVAAMQHLDQRLTRIGG